MAVLDASALIAFATGEPGADVVRTVLGTGEGVNAMSATNLVETVDVLIRRLGMDRVDVAQMTDLLELGGLMIVALDAPLAFRAGAFRATHYRKGTSEISAADAVAATFAEDRADELVTTDRTLARIARAVGIRVIQVPDRASAGG